MGLDLMLSRFLGATSTFQKFNITLMSVLMDKMSMKA